VVEKPLAHKRLFKPAVLAALPQRQTIIAAPETAAALLAWKLLSSS